MMGNVLRKDKSCYTSRAVESNPSSVINLNEIVKRFQDIYEFRSEMMSFLMNNTPDMVNFNLSQSEIKEAELLATVKYKSWEWNFAYGPEYTFNNRFQINREIHTCSLFIKNGIIGKCFIEGSDQMMSIAKKLLGCRHMFADIQKVFEEENIMITDEEIFCFF